MMRVESVFTFALRSFLISSLKVHRAYVSCFLSSTLESLLCLKVNAIGNYFLLLEGSCKQSQKFIGQTAKEYSSIRLKFYGV